MPTGTTSVVSLAANVVLDASVKTEEPLRSQIASSLLSESDFATFNGQRQTKASLDPIYRLCLSGNARDFGSACTPTEHRL